MPLDLNKYLSIAELPQVVRACLSKPAVTFVSPEVLSRHTVSEVFPDLEGREFESLVNDIKENGLLQPLLVFADQVVDGWQRYRACREARIQPIPCIQLIPACEPYLFALARAANIRRRQTNANQRAVLATRLAAARIQAGKQKRSENLKQGNRKPQQTKLDSPRLTTAQQLAAEFNTNEKYVKAALRLMRQQRDDLLAMVLSGEINLGKAEELAKLDRQTVGSGAGQRGAPDARSPKSVRSPMPDHIEDDLRHAEKEVARSLAEAQKIGPEIISKKLQRLTARLHAVREGITSSAVSTRPSVGSEYGEHIEQALIPPSHVRPAIWQNRLINPQLGTAIFMADTDQGEVLVFVDFNKARDATRARAEFPARLQKAMAKKFPELRQIHVFFG